MKLSDTQKRIIAAALGVFVLLGIYSTLFIVIKNKNNQISALQNQVDIEVLKDQRLHSTKQLMADLGEGIEQIDAYFVSEDGVVDFLESLEALGEVSGVSVGVNSVSVDESTDGGLPYELLRIDFVARGLWKNVVQLISLLETFPLGIAIERMQFERLPNSSHWQVNTSFTVLKLK
ncbi:hypothetical protein ACFL6I_18215 [candidate division KSB1 bacterium]